MREYRTQASALAAARRAGMENTVPSYRSVAGGGYAAVVLLRADQRWLVQHVEERGAEALVDPALLPGPPPTGGHGGRHLP